MARLIDADAFKRYAHKRLDIFADELDGMIDEQPTAYDVEKVVGELESDERHTFDGCINKRYAIDIVRKGGAE